MNTDSLQYAGFFPRLKALLCDVLILFVPLMVVSFLGAGQYRLFWLWFLAPQFCLLLFYYLYLVTRYGGTPGKLLVGLRIRRLNGDPVRYREAFLRYLPEIIFSLLTPLALTLGALHVSDAEFFSRPVMMRTQALVDAAPAWYRPLDWIQYLWVGSDLIVFLASEKKRALHDFIAGTVVVRASSLVTSTADAVTQPMLVK